MLTIESEEDTKEEDNVQAEEPSRRTSRGPVQVDVVTTGDRLDMRPAKRGKIVDNSSVGQRPESRMAKTQCEDVGGSCLYNGRRYARGAKSLDGRSQRSRSFFPLLLERKEAPQPKTSEELAEELTLNEEILEQVVAQVEGTVVESLEIASPPPPEEAVRSEIEEKKELKELVVSFPDFLHDSNISLLKYLDGKREKNVVLKEARFYV
ncbi:hypothetical protein AXG93_857s1100 [Marchantia polymorpha subsp. ruderalis]|uniref:Uncharacterized protein n=1 Tax=Marchantia polymorpha subsp. ruderalis TaxID=1480154 RepID=A0A176WC70_MARPO|nr:hypothetical protein AXG93_857s1100 [Marchantia polymorpha subsp. ruderalis]